MNIHYRSSVSLTREQDDDVEGDDYAWENDEKAQQKQEDMSAIIVNDNQAQVSPQQQTFEDSQQKQQHDNIEENSVIGEFLEAKESRRNEIKDNDDEEQIGMSYNNIALPPRGVLQLAPYPLMNQQQHIFFQPSNQPLRAAAFQQSKWINFD